LDAGGIEEGRGWAAAVSQCGGLFFVNWEIYVATKQKRCPDCESPEGGLHALFCTKERCPFCGGQLASCDCISEVLNLSESERKSVAEYIDDSVEPLRSIMKRWENALNLKWRVPFINYPNICAKCGALWPEFFRVPDQEWKQYIQIDMRKQVICRPCFDNIKQLIDSSSPYHPGK
jgi:hypothetical protein